MKAQNEDAICIECREGITNPICPECLAKEMESWNEEMISILIRPETYVGDGVRCLFCGTPMTICAHCYSRDIYDSIEDDQMAEEFMEVFNYGLKEELL